MEDKKLESLLDELGNYANSVGRAAASSIAEVKEVIEKDVQLPDNCPSKAAMAELILRQINGKVSEVTGIMDMVRDHLFEHYGGKK